MSQTTVPRMSDSIWTCLAVPPLIDLRIFHSILTCSYDDMWCNTPKELMEFHDYTFDEHFKQPTPSFLPRKDILNYLVARNSVNGALDGVKYNHTVLSVTYSDNGKFIVKVRDDAKGNEITTQYDKCIWSGGLHGTKFVPRDILEVLKEYSGKVMHSAEATENFENDVKRKKVMIIGDSSSAEDLVLRAVKLGAKHVYVCARSGEGIASETKSWPKDRVTVIFGLPYKVQKGKDFKCQAVYWSEKRDRYRRDDEEEVIKLKDIDTTVLCTGYDANLECLDESLQFDDEGEWEISKGWAMENNALNISVGTVKPSKNLDLGQTCYPDVYRGLLISNPNIMFITENQDSVSPFLDLDVNASLVLGYLTKDVEIPKEKEMMKGNQKQLEAEMQVPWFRMIMDRSYGEEIDELPHGHWNENPEDERAIILNKMPSDFMVRRLARDMKVCKYPMDLGDWKSLSKLGEKVVDLSVRSGKARTNIKKDSPESAWKTFRDVEEGEFTSVFSKKPCSSLPGHWLNLDADENETLTVASVKTKN